MACDRFVNWKKGGKKPTQAEVEKVLRQFFDAASTEVLWSIDRFFVTLVGKGSAPLEGIEGAHCLTPVDQRWIEVHLGKDNLDVITRCGDEFTNACALGLAKIFARFWQGDQ